MDRMKLALAALVVAVVAPTNAFAASCQVIEDATGDTYSWRHEQFGGVLGALEDRPEGRAIDMRELKMKTTSSDLVVDLYVRDVDASLEGDTAQYWMSWAVGETYYRVIAKRSPTGWTFGWDSHVHWSPDSLQEDLARGPFPEKRLQPLSGAISEAADRIRVLFPKGKLAGAADGTMLEYVYVSTVDERAAPTAAAGIVSGDILVSDDGYPEGSGQFGSYELGTAC